MTAMSTDRRRLLTRLHKATNDSIDAQHVESATALVTIATALREDFPAATWLGVHHSENGDWLTPSAVYDESWELLGEDMPGHAEEAVLCLYGNTADTWGTYLVSEDGGDTGVSMFLDGADIECALDLNKILADADTLLADDTPPEAAEYLPAILFHNEALEGWGAVFDSHAWNVTFTLNDGTEVNALVLGQGSRESDGFIGVRFLRTDDDFVVDEATAEPEFLACDEFTQVVYH